VSEKLGVLVANEDKAVQDPEIAIAYVPKPIRPKLTPQFPLPFEATTLSLPKTTTSMQPLLLGESIVRLNSCPAAVVQDSELMNAIHEDVGRGDEYLEIENALPGCILELRSSLLRAATTRRNCVVVFDIINVDRCIAPRYLDDPYRAISISAVEPQPPTILNARATCLYPYESQKGARWEVYRTRGDARASVEKSQASDPAMAVRSAIVLALEPDVDRPAWPVWPEYVCNGEKVTFGMCPFPLRVQTLPNEPSLATDVRTPATRSPDNGMAPAMVGRELHRDVAARGRVQPDNAPNDNVQNTSARPICAAQADPQRSGHLPTCESSSADGGKGSCVSRNSAG
jgi:hypothetical protein